MPKIVQLDELTINQIAAGEVIERPASVVKELVENSIDAGATRITVEVSKGGVELIKISDNGSGIEKEDMLLAFDRHATSKIRSVKDIENVVTMGFRGEALASVASVAKIEMISKTANAEGNKIVLEDGEVVEFKPAASSVGTIISVSNLFYNTPVRYKFLKKDYTEVGYIEDIIRNLSLMNKHIAFKLINNGKVILQTNGDSNFRSVIYSIYGNEIAKNIIEVDEEFDGIRVSGVIGKPEIARSTRRMQIFFVNSRFVKDKVLYNSTDRAFKGLIPLGRFGFCILNVEMNPKFIDVNVHPAKLEVRFENEQAVNKAVYNAIKTGFQKVELVENVSKIKTEKEQVNLNENISKYEYLTKNTKDINEANKNIEIDTVESISEEEDLRKKNEELRKKFEQFNLSERDTKDSKIEDIINNYKQKYGTPQKVLTEMGESLDLTEENDKLLKASNFQDTKNIKTDQTDKDELFPMFGLEDAKNENEENLVDEDQTIKVEFDRENNLSNIEQASSIHEIASGILEQKEQEGFEDTDIVNTEVINKKLEVKKEIEQIASFDEMYEKAFGTEVLEKRIEKRIKEEEKERQINASANLKQVNDASIFKGDKKPYKIIGVLFRTYIVIEVGQEVYMIDQHAAHERVLFEKIRKNYYKSEFRDTQTLLMPDTITLSYREFQTAINNREVFSKAGFEFEEFGINTIRLISVPSMVEILNTKELFLDILDEIDGAESSRKTRNRIQIFSNCCM